ncbi:hypothetical protein [Phycicoccus sonneratiae]|uniref:Exo-alpha-sialidase n=1 Tax=Phycicoccus sonneratiae TaxID=2807628 RepID=A0ABS2CMR4_9MICO|nr:hypothetical protein [Phycicoccus sonneraticus]MBM6401100.1 hypothetical protein [Phycicoccus sonneraticus]
MDRRSLLTAGLAAFFVLDLVLVAYAVRWSSTPAASVGVRSTASGTPTASGSASPTEPAESGSPSPSSSPSTPSPTDTPLTTVLVAASDTEAWVASTGSCGKPGSVSVTGDGGDSWARHDAPGAVTRIRPTSGSEAFVIGGDGDCDLRLWTSTDAAAGWGDPASAARGWARVPESTGDVHTPRDEVVRPCGKAKVLDLSADGGTRATVLCGGGRLRVTTDNGSSWDDTATVEGAVAVAGRPDGSGVVAVVTQECPGTVVQSYDGSEVGKPLCFADAIPAAGRTSVSTSGPAVWLLAGDAVWRTPKLGSDWRSAGSIR